MTEKKSRKYIWLMVPAIFSFLLLAAHFSRQDMNILAVVSLLMPFLLLVRTKWATFILQLSLFAGSAEWVRSTLAYIRIRISLEEDWLRLAIILFSVALITFISAMLLSSKAVRDRNRNN